MPPNYINNYLYIYYLQNRLIVSKLIVFLHKKIRFQILYAETKPCVRFKFVVLQSISENCLAKRNFFTVTRTKILFFFFPVRSLFYLELLLFL